MNLIMAKFWNLFNFTCFVSVFYPCFSISKNGFGFRNSNYDNLDLNKDVLIMEHYGVSTVTACVVLCAEKLQCMSFTFNEVKQVCRLHRSAHVSLSQGFKSEGWMFFVYGGEKCPVNNGFIHDRENDFCIKISEQQLKANEGDYFCTNLSSKLITLETANKQARFEKVLAKIPSSFIIDRYRIGLEFNGQQWMWNNGNLLSYNNWSPYEPNCKCICGGVTVSLHQGWFDNDMYCKNMVAQSVCEMKKM